MAECATRFGAGSGARASSAITGGSTPLWRKLPTTQLRSGGAVLEIVVMVSPMRAEPPRELVDDTL